MIRDIIYFPLKLYVKLFLHIYYKNYQIEGIENIPSGPVIFASNHQNAFMDALLLTCATSRNPYFLARANIFKTKWASVLLKIIRLIPIYRIRDGFSGLKKNEEVINECVNLLSSGESILIFPEGNHLNRFNLRPFQKGVARIAFEAENQNSFNLDLKVVPVGIQYEEYEKTGSSVLVSFGKPVSVKSFENTYLKHPLRATQELIENLEERISNQMVDISPEEKYLELYYQWRIMRAKSSDLVERLRNDQMLINILNEIPQQGADVIQKAGKSHLIRRLVHYPFRIISKVNLMLPDLLIRYIINRKLKEPMFEGSMRFALWAFPGMLIFALQFVLIYLFAMDLLISFGYLFSSILIAIISNKTRPEN